MTIRLTIAQQTMLANVYLIPKQLPRKPKPRPNDLVHLVYSAAGNHPKMTLGLKFLAVLHYKNIWQVKMSESVFLGFFPDQSCVLTMNILVLLIQHAICGINNPILTGITGPRTANMAPGCNPSIKLALHLLFPSYLSLKIEICLK